MTTSLLLRNGYIHSVSEPYANAMHIENGIIAWLGSDETADQLIAATASGPVYTIDLQGALVTPAFIDGYSNTPLAEADARVGISTTWPSAGAVHYTPNITDLDNADGLYLDAANVAQLREVLAELKPPTQLLLEVTSDDEVASVLEMLSLQSNTSLMRSRHRLLVKHDLAPELIETLVNLHVSVTILPDIKDNRPVYYAPVADLIAAGVHVATGTGAWTGSIWSLLTSLIEHPDVDQRLSTRAAFNTMARDGHRVLPSRIVQVQMGKGQIAVGSPAELNVWRAAQLGVQAPDEKAAHWSTDKRAGTALLPILSSAEDHPTLQDMIRHGQIL